MNQIRALWAALIAFGIASTMAIGMLWGLITSQQRLIEDQAKVVGRQRDTIDDLNRKVAALEVKFEICMNELRKKKE